jgi:Tfp pilus assembly protein PilV
MTTPGASTCAARRSPRATALRGKVTRGEGSAGFTVVEVVIAVMVLFVAVVLTAAMFPMGHQQAVDAARTTSAVAVGRQILEDIGGLPFDSVRSLDGFDTANPASAPARDPELALARRWRYMIAGAGGGFGFTTAELAQYGAVTPLGGAASIRVSSPPNGTCSATGSRCQATVTVSVPGLTTNVQLTTIVVRMF